MRSDLMPAPGLYGRRKPDLTRPALRLSRYLTGVVPAHPAAADYLSRLSNWQMLGNAQYGDCVAVTWANTRRLVTAVLSTEHYPSLDDVYTFYKTQNPGFPQQDQGMDIQTALGELVSAGGPDGVKALGFAKVDHADPDEVKAAIAVFGSVWTGINVQQAQQAQFGAGQPWDWVSGSPIDGGHSIIVGGYGEPRAGQLGGDEDFITWAEETSFTDSFWAQGTEEAWVVIWPEHLGSAEFLAGVDLAAFAADYTAITGQPFPVVVPPAPTPVPPAPVPPVPVPVPPVPTPVPPVPTPTPPPPPVPDADPADRDLARAVTKWAYAHRVTDRVERVAVRTWLVKKGFSSKP
jgi:hypothetical protein